MTLDELIAALTAADPDLVCPDGFDNPHSYRGYYTDLAFEPASDVTVGDMLANARSALGATYQGWKGGDFEMDGRTDCWLSMEGSASGESLGGTLVELMLRAAGPSHRPAGVPGVQPHPADHHPVDIALTPALVRFTASASAWQAWWDDHDWDGDALYADLDTAMHAAAQDYRNAEYGYPDEADADEMPAPVLQWRWDHYWWQLHDKGEATGVQLAQVAVYTAAGEEK
jgi:hypothetical protein